MNMRHSRIAAVLALVGLLAACSGGTGAVPLYAQIFATAKTSIALRRMHRAERPPLTRAVLNEVQGSYIEVTLERPDIFAYLTPALIRRDEAPGQIIQWRTEDEVTLSLRNEVLVATRGLGGDMISAQVQVTGDNPGPSAGGERTLYIRTGDLEERPLHMACTLTDLGPETIEIVELAHATRHLQERCSTAEGTHVTNDYWVDRASGIAWQSRQWAGPHIGYLRIRRLTTG